MNSMLTKLGNKRSTRWPLRRCNMNNQHYKQSMT